MLFKAQLARPLVKRLFALLGPDEARLVGGAVRDALVGRYATDIDMATRHRPDQVTQRCTAAGLRVVPTGLDHGTVTVIGHGEVAEVTTLRADVETDGRHATVAFTTDWRIDAARRDFTFNALMLAADGSLVDYFDGLADLRAGRLRFVGEADRRIQEDYLRILRLFRFWARFGRQALADVDVAALRRHLDGLDQLAGERVWSEVSKLLVARRAVPALQMMREIGVDQQLFGQRFELDRVAQVQARARAHGLPADPVLMLRAIGITSGLLKLSNAEKARLRQAEGDSTAWRLWLYGPARVAADLVLAGGSVAQWDAVHRWRRIDMPIGGRDLIALGVAPGPALGAVLKRLERAWVDSGFSLDRDGLLAVMETPR